VWPTPYFTNKPLRESQAEAGTTPGAVKGWQTRKGGGGDPVTPAGTDNASSAARAALKHPRYENANKELRAHGFTVSGEPSGDGRSWAEYRYAHPDGSKLTLRYDRTPTGTRRSVKKEAP
jgi:hypothetical protein